VLALFIDDSFSSTIDYVVFCFFILVFLWIVFIFMFLSTVIYTVIFLVAGSCHLVMM